MYFLNFFNSADLKFPPCTGLTCFHTSAAALVSLNDFFNIADRSLYEAFINLFLYSLLCFKLENDMLAVS